MDIVLEVLKWVVIVLIAGFIGQFGKTMSQRVMDYFKRFTEIAKGGGDYSKTCHKEQGEQVYCENCFDVVIDKVESESGLVFCSEACKDEVV